MTDDRRRQLDALKEWIGLIASPALFALCAWFLMGISGDVEQATDKLAKIEGQIGVLQTEVTRDRRETERSFDRAERRLDRLDERTRTLEAVR